MRHLMSPLDLSVEELEHLLDLANDIEQNPEKYAHACDGKKIATLFYEPSTRTRLSFEAAMMNLGGKALGFSSADSSSASKGESVSDTIRVVSCFADIFHFDLRTNTVSDHRFELFFNIFTDYKNHFVKSCFFCIIDRVIHNDLSIVRHLCQLFDSCSEP